MYMHVRRVELKIEFTYVSYMLSTWRPWTQSTVRCLVLNEYRNDTSTCTH